MNAKDLFDLADKQAKLLQKKQGRYPQGIVSTQVQGLIIALGVLLEDNERTRRETPKRPEDNSGR